jgi:hypothetical protein
MEGSLASIKEFYVSQLEVAQVGDSKIQNKVLRE